MIRNCKFSSDEKNALKLDPNHNVNLIEFSNQFLSFYFLFLIEQFKNFDIEYKTKKDIISINVDYHQSEFFALFLCKLSESLE